MFFRSRGNPKKTITTVATKLQIVGDIINHSAFQLQTNFHYDARQTDCWAPVLVQKIYGTGSRNNNGNNSRSSTCSNKFK